MDHELAYVDGHFVYTRQVAAHFRVNLGHG